mgnify:CR=1 FL=1
MTNQKEAETSQTIVIFYGIPMYICFPRLYFTQRLTWGRDITWTPLRFEKRQVKYIFFENLFRIKLFFRTEVLHTPHISHQVDNGVYVSQGKSTGWGHSLEDVNILERQHVP